MTITKSELLKRGMDDGIAKYLARELSGGAGATDITITQTSTSVTVNSSTGTDGSIPSADTSNAGVMSASDKSDLNASKIGFLGTNSKSADYTLVASDAGKTIVHPASDANSRAFTIDTIANVGWTGTPVIRFRNASTNSITIVPAAGVTFDRADGTNGTGTRTVAGYSTAIATMDLGSNAWSIEGGSLS